MDEGSGTTAYDYSGYGNNGTLYNGTNICSNPPNSGCPTWVDGMIGRAISFDGVNDYVNVYDSINLRTVPFTVEFWINLSSWTTYKRIIGKGDGYYIPGGWHIEVFGNNFRFYWNYDRSAFDSLLASGVTIEANRWYHVVAIHTGSRAYLYVNGIAHSKSTTLTPTGASGYPLQIGGTTYSGQYINATIDEVRIYNRVLSEEEIKQLYYNGLTNKFNITIGLLNFGFADLGNSFNAIVYLKNGTILQLPLILNRDLTKGSYLEKTLTIDGYYPSYGLVDKVMVCSNDCQGVCSEIIVNNQC
jgi:hypothetical protein